jgi:hypothetical protein
MNIFNDNSIAQFIFNDNYLLAKIYHYLIIDTDIGNTIDIHKLNKLRLINHKSSQIIPMNFLRYGTMFSILYSKIKSALIILLLKSPFYHYEQHNDSFKIFALIGRQGNTGYVSECDGPKGAIGPVGEAGCYGGRSDKIKRIKQRLIEKSYRKFSYHKSSYQLHKVSSRAHIKNMYRKSKN